MDELIRFLDDHSGSVIVLVTVAYVLITALLRFEARANRATGSVANLDVHPRPFGPVYVELVLENYGPATARSVRFRRWIEVNGEIVPGTERTQAEPTFPVGRRRRFLESASEGQIDALQTLAERAAVLHAEWSWTDDRRRFGLRTVTHQESVAYRAQELRDGFYGGHALSERDPAERDDQMSEETRKTRAALEDIAKTLKDPAMAFYIRKMLDEAGVEPPTRQGSRASPRKPAEPRAKAPRD